MATARARELSAWLAACLISRLCIGLYERPQPPKAAKQATRPDLADHDMKVPLTDVRGTWVHAVVSHLPPVSEWDPPQDVGLQQDLSRLANKPMLSRGLSHSSVALAMRSAASVYGSSADTHIGDATSSTRSTGGKA